MDSDVEERDEGKILQASSRRYLQSARTSRQGPREERYFHFLGEVSTTEIHQCSTDSFFFNIKGRCFPKTIQLEIPKH
jgi:hypothetical protein